MTRIDRRRVATLAYSVLRLLPVVLEVDAVFADRHEDGDDDPAAQQQEDAGHAPQRQRLPTHFRASGVWANTIWPPSAKRSSVFSLEIEAQFGAEVLEQGWKSSGFSLAPVCNSFAFSPGHRKLH